MRTVRYSRSSYDEFALLLEQGVDRFGPQVVAQKRAKVLETVETFLARHFPDVTREHAIGVGTGALPGGHDCR